MNLVLLYIICVILVLVIFCMNGDTFQAVGCSITSAFIAIGKFLISCWKAYYRSVETALNYLMNIHRVRITVNDPRRQLNEYNQRQSNEYQQIYGCKPMNGTEYEMFYACGRMPERFWPGEIKKLNQELLDEKINIQEFEDNLDDMMGIKSKKKEMM
jgi:hypothetical protein